MPPKVISGGDNPYDIHDAKLSSSATAHESSSVTAHEISNSPTKHSFKCFSGFYYTRFLNSTFSVYFRLKFHVDFRKSVYTFFHYGYPCL